MIEEVRRGPLQPGPSRFESIYRRDRTPACEGIDLGARRHAAGQIDGERAEVAKSAAARHALKNEVEAAGIEPGHLDDLGAAS